MSVYNLLFNRKSVENPASFTLKNAWKFLKGNYYKFLMKFFSKSAIESCRLEQYEWRKTQVQLKSPECILKKECFCGCDLEGLLLSDEGCNEKNKCYPPLMNNFDWFYFKRDNNIK